MKNDPISETFTETTASSPDVLSEIEEAGGVIWVEVMDADGRIGWIPEAYLHQVTATPSP